MIKTLKFNGKKYEELYRGWASPPRVQAYVCQCGIIFNGVWGGIGDFCPKCGDYRVAYFNHIGPPPVAGAPWSEDAKKMRLDECYEPERGEG